MNANQMIEESLQRAITEKMSAAGASELIQSAFLRAVAVVKSGQDGLIEEASIKPAPQLPDIERLADHSRSGADALDKTVVIKLNGGLGTSMGLNKAKSLLPVKNDSTFLDIIAQQVLFLREQHRADVPLVFMNSFRTEDDTLSKLRQIPGIQAGQGDVSFSFLQNKVPKLDAATYLPVTHANDAELEWCPPGHGDIYVALKQSGLLAQLLERGYQYAFVSNADNLGASLDVNLLGYFAETSAPFLMEVADRTAADKKGGHLATRRSDGRLLLREVAQCPDDDLAAFQDINRHRYFNTNSLWLSLPLVSDVLDSYDGVLPLPVIVNRKTVDPTDNASTDVLQLESAMGAAIEIFENAQAVRVGRDRFLPVKQTSDLLLLMSDLFRLEPSGTLVRVTEGRLPTVELDSRFYKNIDDFLARFVSMPSLRECSSLKLSGDVRFDKEVSMRGDVVVTAPAGSSRVIAAGSVLDGSADS